ncbi:hypothetical protein G7Z17_g625 [Cylindrodendrum hubeiense]|uniref:Uncharacterized protein n=1 Tax=Cylindrodendrum hubeiense TaxID=595255 RepID=A0A9P5LKY2_9HYPO|nr:hypothetical protein G7Z17_g625 [Cylindrodendrum hubeiense]
MVKYLPGVSENMAENFDAGVLGFANVDINRNTFQIGLLLKTPIDTTDRQYMYAMAHMQPRSRAGSDRLRSADPMNTPEINFRFWEVGNEEDLRELVDAVNIMRMRRGFQEAEATCIDTL